MGGKSTNDYKMAYRTNNILTLILSVHMKENIVVKTGHI